VSVAASDWAFQALDWLIRKLRVYLNGFRNRGIEPKTRKDSQKVAGEKYEPRALTTLALSMLSQYATLTFH
jgi:hypothetical protein